MQEKEEVDVLELVSADSIRNTLDEIESVKEDLQKTFLDSMLLNDVDYLIFDIILKYNAEYFLIVIHF